MTRSGRLAAALAVAAGFTFGLISLFNRQFASGEVYPAFSSLRTDRLGTKILYDSLARLPGITVERAFTPLRVLPRDGVAVLLLGLNPAKVNWNDGRLLDIAEAVASRGNRVVLALAKDDELTQAALDRRPDKSAPSEPPLRTRWQVRLELQKSLAFRDAAGWTALRSGFALERAFGKGSIVLLADSRDFSNQAAVDLQGFKEVSITLGSFRQIVFDEHHLGLAESGSIVAMARRFRLTGLALGLALCAALFIWRNASAFPPPVPRSSERFSGRTSHAGLLTLLRRHIAPPELTAVCWREWLATNRGHVRPDILQEAEAIVAASAARPLDAARQIQTLLRSKGRA